MSQDDTEPRSEFGRQEVFLALVLAQDQSVSVQKSRRDLSQRFGITEAEVVRIEGRGPGQRLAAL